MVPDTGETRVDNEVLTISSAKIPVCLLFCAVLTMLYLVKENKRKAAERLRAKQPPVVHGEEHHNESIWFEYVM